MSSAGWYGQPKCRLCLPWKNFCGCPCLCNMYLQSNICFVLRSIIIFVLFEYPLFQPLSVSVSLNVRFTKIGVCSKTYNHTYVARTNEDLSPYICNFCEFAGTNYCMPTRWLTGPLQKISPPGSNFWLRHWLWAALFDSPRGGTFSCRGPACPRSFQLSCIYCDSWCIPSYHGFGSAITAYSYTDRQPMARKYDIFLD